MPEYLPRPVFDPPPPSQFRRLLTSPSSIGAITAATLAVYPRILTGSTGIRTRIPDGAAAILGIVPGQVYAVLVGFMLGYGMTKGIDWLRWKVIKSLISYHGWVRNPRSAKTKVSIV